MYQLNWQRVVVLFAVVLLAGCIAPTELPTSATLVKSANDARQYRYLELDNGLKVLLVSDSEAERAAAALDVHVGSRNDPENYQGLAHFLEHMLFLGTEKYPEAGEYQAFISGHGGSHNAYTSFEHTNYFFDIAPDYFEPALDRFAQFFIAPLFTESYVEREKNAVHSEYTAKIKDEMRRSADVFKSVINPAHPFTTLSVGNLTTLAGGKATQADGHLREQLIRFYQQFYSANIMTLVLVSPEPLDTLEAMAYNKFSVVNSNPGQRVEAIDEPLFADNSLPLMVEIKPEKSLRMLTVAFPTAGVEDLYRQKPMHFIGNILGHEGKGSLLSYLKKQGWSEGLSAGLGLSYRGGATFNLTVHLTKSGVEHHRQIVSAVFQAINRVREKTDKRWLFEEQKALAEQQFLYQQKSQPINYASRLASGMHYYEQSDILSGAYLMRDYDARQIDHFLSYLTPQNGLITLVAPSVKTDRVTQFYSTPYSVNPVSDEQINRWTSAGLNPDIQLPEKNPFIASDFAIKQFESAGDTPQLALEQPGMRVWYQPLNRFQSPRGSLFFSVHSPLANDTAEHKVSMQMLTALVADQLNELSYSASLAGLDYSLTPHIRGFSVKINGFNDRQELLLAEILKALKSPAFDAERFANIKRERIRKLENKAKKQPYQLIMGELNDLLYQGSWADESLLAAYKALTVEQLKGYQQAMLASVSIDVLAHGNFRPEEASGFGQQIAQALLTRASTTQTIDIVKLDNKVISRRLDSHYDDASLLLYIQAGDLDRSRRAAMGVSAQIMRADFYTRLRTEKQLGYIVSSGAYPVMDVPGLFFLVQSPVAAAGQLQEEIQQYLLQWSERLSQMSEEAFNQHRRALVSRLAEAPQNLRQQSERYWQDITQGYYGFDFRTQLISAIEALSFEQWQSAVQQDIVNNDRRLWIYTAGKFADKGLAATESVDDIRRFKSSQPGYSFPR